MNFLPFCENLTFYDFCDFLTFWIPWTSERGSHVTNAVPWSTLPTVSHRPPLPNATPPRTLPTLSHHHAVNGIPHCERYRTSHTANAIPPSTLLTLPHLPHCQHYPITCIAESITRIAKSPVPGSTLPNYQSECQAIRLSAKHPN